MVSATPATLHRQRDSVPVVHVAGWALWPVLTLSENLASSGFDPLTVHPVAGRYIKWAYFFANNSARLFTCSFLWYRKYGYTLLTIEVFWGVTLWLRAGVSRLSERIYFLHLVLSSARRTIMRERLFFQDCLILALEGRTLWCFRKSGTTHLKTQVHIPEDLNPQQYCCVNLMIPVVQLYGEATRRWVRWPQNLDQIS